MWRILIFMEGKCHEGLSVCFYKEVSDADGCTISEISCILIGNTENLPLAASLAYFVQECLGILVARCASCNA